MTRKSKKYQLLVSALLLCFLQVAGIDVYAQSTVTPVRKDTTIIQREAPKARARRHREPIAQDSTRQDSIRIIPSKELPAIDSLSAAKIQIADSLDAANKKELKKIEQPSSIVGCCRSYPDTDGTADCLQWRSGCPSGNTCSQTPPADAMQRYQ